jgi:hypothetical protein
MTLPLVADGDTDLAGWQAAEQSTFLEMACAEVRRFCGWHIAPAENIADKVFRIGSGGLVMLGSTHVTEINSVIVDGQTLAADIDYTWEQPKGWLRVHAHSLPRPGVHHAGVSFTSGFGETPPPVKAVIFEVLATAMELPASNADDVETVQYKYKLKSSVGIALSDQQKERLGPYRLRSFGGRTQL